MKSRSGEWIKSHASFEGDECLIWPFGRDAYGYGRASLKGHSSRLAHRIMCEVVHGEAPFHGAVAMHKCGMGHNGCVNPRHLKWGTTVENNAHKCQMGNQPRGEAIGVSVLCESRVSKIRQMAARGISQRKIAKAIGAHHATVQAVIERRTWQHV